MIILGGRLPETENERIRLCNFWPKKWLRPLKKFEWWSLMRELLKQYLTEKQNCSCLRSGRLWEVVAMRELTVFS